MASVIAAIEEMLLRVPYLPVSHIYDSLQRKKLWTDPDITPFLQAHPEHFHQHPNGAWMLNPERLRLLLPDHRP